MDVLIKSNWGIVGRRYNKRAKKFEFMLYLVNGAESTYLIVAWQI